MLKSMLRAGVLALLVSQSIPPAACAAEIPFPEIDSNAFCTELVSKMLDPSEKYIEFIKCLFAEKVSEYRTKPYWEYIDEKQKIYILKYFTEPKFTSYYYLEGYMYGPIGLKCLRKEMSCH